MLMGLMLRMLEVSIGCIDSGIPRFDPWRPSHNNKHLLEFKVSACFVRERFRDQVPLHGGGIRAEAR